MSNVASLNALLATPGPKNIATFSMPYVQSRADESIKREKAPHVDMRPAQGLGSRRSRVFDSEAASRFESTPLYQLTRPPPQAAGTIQLPLPNWGRKCLSDAERRTFGLGHACVGLGVVDERAT